MADWTIQSRQRPAIDPKLEFLNSLSRFSGIEPGHNYLVLVDPNGKINKQIHGISQFENGSLKLRLSRGNYSRPQDEPTATVIESGDEAEMKQRFSNYDQHAETLNGLGIDYGVATDNSNSFWATLLRMEGKDPKQFRPSNDVWAPGTDDDLREWQPRVQDNLNQP